MSRQEQNPRNYCSPGVTDVLRLNPGEHSKECIQEVAGLVNSAHGKSASFSNLEIRARAHHCVGLSHPVLRKLTVRGSVLSK